MKKNEYDQAWNVATNIYIPAQREEAQFEVVQALSKARRFDQAILLAEQIERDPWDRSIRRNQQRHAYQTIVEILILDRQFDRAKGFAEKHFQKDDNIFEYIRREEESSSRSFDKLDDNN